MPVTLLGLTYSELNYSANRFLSGISAMWAYILNSLIQVCLACNRFYGLYFPFGIKIWKHVPMTNLAIMIAVTITSVLSLVTFPVGCGYVYDPSFFLWRPEDHECSKRISVIFPFVILTTTIITNTFNVAVGIRLLVRKIGGVREQEAKERRKRWMIMFTQSVLQDCLQLFDINSYYIVLLSEKVWFRFLFVTLSLVTISALDGLVMFACNSDIHPTWIKKLTSKKSKTIPVPVTCSGQSFHK
ncbi:unnamed protein product [Caenorhabditis brenneri]